MAKRKIFATPYEDPVYMRDRACYGLPIEIFHPEAGGKFAKAQRVCKQCPVLDLCRTYYLSDESTGYVAGMTPMERVQARKDLMGQAS